MVRRTVSFGQQSVNIRGIGLLDSGGAEDLTQGYRVQDIENIVLAQSNGVPVKIKDVAKVYIGYLPRLGKAGRDRQGDIVAAIVVMNRTLHTNDVVPRIKAEVEKINSHGTLPPGVKLVPFYDRTTLVSVTTSTVLHNLFFGCLLVFFVQWLFLGNAEECKPVAVNASSVALAGPRSVYTFTFLRSKVSLPCLCSAEPPAYPATS